MTTPRRMTSAAAAVCLAGVGLALAATGASAATPQAAVPQKAGAAPAAPGSKLGAISVTATSAATQLPLYEHQGEDVQASIPYSTSTLGSGGTGSSTTSILWPGATGANAGSALQLLGISQIPASVEQMLNDPEIATAQTGVGAKTVSLSHPGLAMTATATPTHVSSYSEAGGQGVELLGQVVGNTSATTNIKVAGPKRVVVTATNSIHHIDIDKMIAIDSLTTRLRAVTNGKTSRGSQHTIISGMKIDGIPVRLDSDGLNVATGGPVAGPLAPVSTLLGSTVPLTTVTTTAVAAVNSALKAAGISISLTPATKRTHKGHVKITSRSLVVKLANPSYTSQANTSDNLLVLGAASINALATPGFATPTIKPVSSPPAKTSAASGASTAVGTSGGSSGAGGTPGTAPAPGTPATVSTAPAVAGAPTNAPVQTQLAAANPLSLPGGLSPVWIVVALIGAGALAYGLRRLPDKLLATTGPACGIKD